MGERVTESLRQPADETLDYAILAALLAVGTALITLTMSWLSILQATLLTITITFVVAFFITPRLVAWWTGTPVQSLVNTR